MTAPSHMARDSTRACLKLGPRFWEGREEGLPRASADPRPESPIPSSPRSPGAPAQVSPTVLKEAEARVLPSGTPSPAAHNLLPVTCRGGRRAPLPGLREGGPGRAGSRQGRRPGSAPAGLRVSPAGRPSRLRSGRAWGGAEGPGAAGGRGGAGHRTSFHSRRQSRAPARPSAP